MPDTGEVLKGYAISILKIIAVLIVAVLLPSLVDLGIVAAIVAYYTATTGSVSQATDVVAGLLQNIWLMFGLTAVQDLMWVLLAIGFVVLLDRRKPALEALGLKLSPEAIKMFLAGIGLNVAFGAVTVASLLLAGWSHIAENGLEAYGLAAVAGSLAITIPMMFIVGLGEETLFRGYIQTGLARKHGTLPALLLASLAFAGLHIGFLIPGQEVSPLSIAGIFCASLVMGYLYVITGTIWASIGFHFCQDVLGAGVFLTGQLPYESAPVFLMAKATDLKLAGISLGGVDNLVNIALLLLVLALLYFYHRRTQKQAMKK